MAPRQSRVTASKSQTKAPKTRNKTSKRAHNAYTIASYQEVSEPKIRPGRLGDLEGPNTARAGARATSDDRDDASGSEESDSSGNQWHVGQHSDDEDSDLDSDEAFGESDEERFEGFTFRGSQSSQKPKNKADRNGSVSHKNTQKELNLLDEGSHDEQVEDEDDFGDEGVNLDTLLESNFSSGESMDEDGSASEEEDSSDSDVSISEDEDNADQGKLHTLQDLVANLDEEDRARQPKRRRIGEGVESMNPSDHAITSSTKLTLADMMATVTDPKLKASLALLEAPVTAKSKESKKKGTIPGKLEAPLPKRQQDRIDRSAAYKQSKETLDRWIDTVKRNRRAAHLSFPLSDPDGDVAGSYKRLARASMAPMNTFEAKLQQIMVDSGLEGNAGNKDEEKFQALEDQQARKFSAQDIAQRRAEMRRTRDLIFREEVRAKRIKKIKSRAYRRVNRKKRNRDELEEQLALEEEGEELAQEDRDKLERLRAEQRMGSRIRSSRWAKMAKGAGRANWDDDLRDGLAVATAKEDNLQRRMKGLAARAENGEGLASEDDDSDSSDQDVDSETGIDLQPGRLEEQIRGLEDVSENYGQGQFSKLANLPFMKRAQEARRISNDEAIKDLKHTLEGSDASDSDSINDLAGRRLYRPNGASTEKLQIEKFPNAELDEGFLSGDETPWDRRLQLPDVEAGTTNTRLRREPSDLAINKNLEDEQEQALKSQPTGHKFRNKSQALDSVLLKTQDLLAPVDNTRGIVQSNIKRQGKKMHKGRDKHLDREKPVILEQALSDNESTSEVEQSNPVKKPTLADLIGDGFAGDEVEKKFQKEKEATMIEDDDQVIDKTLPGWGSWTGAGVSKKVEKRNKGKVLELVKGIAKDKRKDAKLARVLISEKKVKKNAKYLASSLPHPYESQQQYERSMRLPVGPEWTTKETFQKATKPRLLIKQGVITPISRPIL